MFSARLSSLSLLLVAGAPLFFAGCTTTSQRQPPPVETTETALVVSCSSFTCNISESAWNHISSRHCGACVANDKSAFVSAYCGDKAAAVSFCQAIISAGNCTAAQQPNGRFAATATLGSDVGKDSKAACGATRTGTVIFESNKTSVVTQFPGTP
ncbi:hypothetical protein JQX13_04090 [Archangium violaceum]|uniref:hypothetical protein n=1 Tax=Archangium violaceum TaxID=83451 RepID=UPI00193AF4DD|nr:hypothetical protein [Archangium violaceum]QRK09336.1 hypothetical protein JQX13_04090 [Archangium violaceum]